jgi:hypothetical protein
MPEPARQTISIEEAPLLSDEEVAELKPPSWRDSARSWDTRQQALATVALSAEEESSRRERREGMEDVKTTRQMLGLLTMFAVGYLAAKPESPYALPLLSVALFLLGIQLIATAVIYSDSRGG